MRKQTLTGSVLLAVLALCPSANAAPELPAPQRAGGMSLAEALAKRRSVRRFAPTAPTAAQVSQLLWAAQGQTDARGYRTAPSAGALFPLEIYAVTAGGCRHYVPRAHRLEPRTGTDLRPAIQAASLGQEAVRAAPVVFVITGVESRTARKYGSRARRYAYLEAGHAAQNLLLQATALGLGGVVIGAFRDDQLARVMGLPAGEVPLYVIPVGRPL